MIVMPLYNIIVVPRIKLYFSADNFQNRTGKEPEAGKKVVFLMAKEEIDKQKMTEDGFYPIAVTGIITEISGNGFVEVRTQERVHVDSILIGTEGGISLTISPQPDTDLLPQEEQTQRTEAMKSSLQKFVTRFPWGPMARSYISHWESVGEIAAVLSPWFTTSSADKYAIIAEDSEIRRTEMIEKEIYEYVEMSKLSSEAENEQEEDYKKTYRESAIKKQMEYLQKELDAMHPENVTDIRKFELKIEESGMNDTARAEADKVLNRLKQEGKNSAEYGMLYDYLDFITSLSWKTEETKPVDIQRAEEILEEDHFGLKKVKKRIIQQIAVMNLRRQQSGSILLFVGAPGTGKTSIGQSIARAMNRKYVRVSLGGVRDEADIRGHRRTYIGAMPGRIMDGIAKSGVSNPVMVLDEVDKLGQSYNGDPASALLEVLDPEQNSTFTDHYMNVPYDLSNVMFICTANSLDTIPEPLLNRMEVIQFPGYTASDKFEIAKRHLLPKAMKSVGLKEENLSIDDEALRDIISDYTMEAGVRGLKKRLDSLCRCAAVEIVKGEAEHLDVTGENLREYLDAKPIHHEHILAKKKPGIVTGLAWTSAGGEILFIETLFTKGSGKIILTGQLGDVMKESAQIAVSLVKYMYPDKAELFEKNDLHIHVPSGAVPKDGPSAGITLTTAIASLVTGKSVSPEFAMTGEVSLRGAVTPIGGLPEKLMAALRAGIKTVLIPQENVEDLDEVPNEAKEKLNIVPVSTVDDVLKAVGIAKGRRMRTTNDVA